MTSRPFSSAPDPAEAAASQEVFFPQSWARPQSKFLEVEELPPDAAWVAWEAALAAQARSAELDGAAADHGSDFPATQVLPLE